MTVDKLSCPPRDYLDKKGYIEIRNSPIFLENDERLDPLVNIATGIRWFGRMKKMPLVKTDHYIWKEQWS